MRLKRALGARSTQILLLAATLLCAIALPGHTGAGAAGLSSPTRSSIPTRVASLPIPTEGGRIAFASGREIYLINSDGSGLTQLTHSDFGVYNYQPALSPDGTRVAFARIQGDQAGISIIDVDGTGLRILTTNKLSGDEPDTNNVGSDSEPAWSPDGSKIAFVRGHDPTWDGVAYFSTCHGPGRIYVVNVDSVASEIINLTPGQNATDPAWSPDGTRIAFASNEDGDYDIYSMRIDGTDVQQLTRTDAQEAEPAWSPDGRTIAYAQYLRVDVYCGFIHTGREYPPTMAGQHIYLMSSDGSNQTRLTNKGNNIEPTWSPDGASLAFVRFDRDAFEIWVLDTEHRTEFCIISDSNLKSSPSWSRADPRLAAGLK